MKNEMKRVAAGIFILLFSSIVCVAQIKLNPKQNCIYTAWNGNIGSSNNMFFSAEKSLAYRKSRKVNVLNKSEYTYLSAGLIGHLDRSPSKLYFGPTIQFQAGFAKFKHFWPTLRYTYLVNESDNPNRVNIGLSYLPFKNCGFSYSYTLNNVAHRTYNLKHHFGLVFNIKHNKLKCFEQPQKEKAQK